MTIVINNCLWKQKNQSLYIYIIASNILLKRNSFQENEKYKVYIGRDFLIYIF